MNMVESLINELKKDSCELYYKERDMNQKITILENMIVEATELRRILKKELEKENEKG